MLPVPFVRWVWALTVEIELVPFVVVVGFPLRAA